MDRAATGKSTMVVSPHYLASRAGAEILRKGGNAFDAAIAVSATLAVVYPHMTGLGGDSFWLIYHREDGVIRGYNGSGRSGYLASRHRFEGESEIPVRGIRSIVTVPGMVDSWDAVLREYGKLTMADVLEPAIRYAEEGFPFSRDQYRNTRLCYELLARTPYTSQIFTPGNQSPEVGSRFVQKDLARSLRKIAQQGRDVFYKGELAQEIITYLRENGGLLVAEDFADHTGDWVTPITGSYRGITLYQLPPNSQGFTGIMAAHILENFDFQLIEHGSYEYYHLLIETLKQTFRDRDRFLTDPDFSQVPVEKLISKTYCSTLASSIDMNRALSLETEPMGGDTAYAAVIDEEGNAVSFIQSLYFEFGSAVVAGNTGILLQNRGSFFSLDPNHVNRLEPRKRTFHTLMPAMAFRDGRPFLLYGTQGGEGQPQTQTALLTRVIDYGMTPQEAIDQPRWVWGRTWGEKTQELKVESRISPEVLDLLEKAGHLVRKVADFDSVVGHAQMILIDEHGVRGASDPRSDGGAIGW